jgi:hypothetical protein
MSATAVAVLEQLKKLPRSEQQEVYERLLRLLQPAPQKLERPFPTARVNGGTITSQQVAEALDDE